jgi:hypothetical protein
VKRKLFWAGLVSLTFVVGVVLRHSSNQAAATLSPSDSVLRQDIAAPIMEFPAVSPHQTVPPLVARTDAPYPLAANIMAQPRWQPRRPSEWQGMLVNLNLAPPCDSTSHCGLARICKGGKCLPCEQDGDCMADEECVLDHCIRRALATCRGRADCGPRAVCLLSGYSSGHRGNEDMRSLCVDPMSGAKSAPSSPQAIPQVDERKSLPNDDLIDQARRAAESDF